MRLVDPGDRADLAHWLPRSEPHLAAALALDGAGFTIYNLLDAIIDGEVQLWVGEHSAMATHLRDYPSGRCCVIWLAGGNLDEILAADPIIAAYAREKGCVQVELHGRRGWEKTLRPLGYEFQHVMVLKKL